ncbi:hypothetical protein [Streptomyces werraensis]|uniref:hypothetical protein n=1 Tax=Streptomyces werraensis TaxID=68284 RepID=UPI00381057C0
MDAQVTAGWIGPAGASVGATSALLGAWFQQRWQVKTARENRQAGYARQAGETAFDAFVQMQQAVYAYVREHSGEDGEDHKTQVTDKVASLAHTLRSQIMLTSGAAELRERLDEVIQIVIGFTATAPGTGRTVRSARNT